MAKALVGYVGGIDDRRAPLTWQLRRRVADLEAEVLRLKQENDALAAAYTRASADLAVTVDDDISRIDTSSELLAPVAR
ncbi:MAG: hypothetical protein ACRDP1_07025 [Nocardioidaceae bacterium]